jgi:hypothetical protein
MLLALWFEKIASCYWLESLVMGGLSGPGAGAWLALGVHRWASL